MTTGGGWAARQRPRTWQGNARLAALAAAVLVLAGCAVPFSLQSDSDQGSASSSHRTLRGGNSLYLQEQERRALERRGPTWDFVVPDRP